MITYHKNGVENENKSQLSKEEKKESMGLTLSMGDVVSSELITTDDAIAAKNVLIAEVGQVKPRGTVNLVTPSIDHPEGKVNTIEIKNRFHNMKMKVKNKIS